MPTGKQSQTETAVYYARQQQNLGAQAAPSETDLLSAILYNLTPPTVGTPHIIALAQDGPIPIVSAQAPGLKFWTLRNTGTKNIFFWYFSAAAQPSDYEQIGPGEFQSSPTNPGVIYAARTAGDTTASLTYTEWYN